MLLCNKCLEPGLEPLLVASVEQRWDTTKTLPPPCELAGYYCLLPLLGCSRWSLLQMWQRALHGWTPIGTCCPVNPGLGLVCESSLPTQICIWMLWSWRGAGSRFRGTPCSLTWNSAKNQTVLQVLKTQVPMPSLVLQRQVCSKNKFANNHKCNLELLDILILAQNWPRLLDTLKDWHKHSQTKLADKT